MSSKIKSGSSRPIVMGFMMKQPQAGRMSYKQYVVKYNIQMETDKLTTENQNVITKTHRTDWKELIV